LTSLVVLSEERFFFHFARTEGSCFFFFCRRSNVLLTLRNSACPFPFLFGGICSLAPRLRLFIGGWCGEVFFLLSSNRLFGQLPIALLLLSGRLLFLRRSSATVVPSHDRHRRRDVFPSPSLTSLRSLPSRARVRPVVAPFSPPK